MNLWQCTSALTEAFSGGSGAVICMNLTWSEALMVQNVFSCCVKQTAESDQHSHVTLEEMISDNYKL